MSEMDHYETGKQALQAKDYGKALKFLEPLAKKGHGEAQQLIGDLYLYGKGTEQNIAQGLCWYQKASDQGNPLACQALALLYDPLQNHPDLPPGQIEPDEALAKEYHRKAFSAYLRLAEGGDRDAQHNVANYYFLGLDEAANKEKALFWYTRAAENGNPYSCAQLAYFYFDRDGKNNEEARRWYQMGIRFGHKVFHIPELEESADTGAQLK